MEQPTKSGGVWKWVAGAFALVISYGAGFEAGRDESRTTSGQTEEVASFVEATSAPILAEAEPADPALLPSATPAKPETALPTDEVDGRNSEAAGFATGSLHASETSTSSTELTPAILAAATQAALDDDGEDEPSAPSLETALSSVPSVDTASSPNPVGDDSTSSSVAYSAPIALPSRSTGGCAENGSCYGDVSSATGRAKTISVGGYYRRDGTYVRGHYRSSARRR